MRIRDNGKYSARIQKNGKSVFLGVFNTINEAQTAYSSAAASLFEQYARTGE